ncbi:hypothetical protein [Paenibacillus sp. HW567]|nr:hypothetical protein [Paenibacillus sp. HW567]
MKSLTKDSDIWTNLSAKELKELPVPSACCAKVTVKISNPNQKAS